MAEGHRLGGLQMGEARHDRVGMLPRPGRASACMQRRPAARRARSHCVAHPEAEIERHLVVARARGVQAPGGLADQLGQPRLDVHVDVFELARERERPAFDLWHGS